MKPISSYANQNFPLRKFENKVVFSKQNIFPCLQKKKKKKNTYWAGKIAKLSTLNQSPRGRREPSPRSRLVTSICGYVCTYTNPKCGNNLF